MSFEKAYEEYLEYARNQHKKQGFITLHTDFKNQVLPYFIGKNLEEITKLDIATWKNVLLSKKYSNKYLAKIYSTFKTFMDYCVFNTYIKINVVSEVGRFKRKIEYHEYVVYNLFQFIRFRFHLQYWIDKLYFTFMYFYGTRPGETMALRFLDIKKRIITIQHNIHRKGDRELDTPKNQSSIRKLKLGLLMYLAIFVLKLYYTKNYGVFCNDYFIFGGQKPLSPTTIDRHKKVACEKANLPLIKQHEFRHSYATRNINRKKSINKISKSLGHSSVSTTLNIYVH